VACEDVSKSIETSVGSDVTGNSAGGSESPIGVNQESPEGMFANWTMIEGLVAGAFFVGLLAASNKVYGKLNANNSYIELAEVVLE